MDLELNGKVAIVGGASRGLGRACAEVLAEEGARVAMCARTPSVLEQAADEIRAATERISSPTPATWTTRRPSPSWWRTPPRTSGRSTS